MSPATYTAPGPRSTAAILALYVKVGACFLAIGADVRRILVADRLGDGRAQVDDLLAADQLVTVATAIEALALVVAVVLVLRWLLGVRGNRAALGSGPAGEGPLRAGAPGLVVPWLVFLAVTTLALLGVWVGLGDAEFVDERQRIDALRAGATLLSAIASGLTILVVSRVTAHQDGRAAEVDPPRAPPRARRRRGRAAEAPAEGSLRVVSEAEVRRRTEEETQPRTGRDGA